MNDVRLPFRTIPGVRQRALDTFGETLADPRFVRAGDAGAFEAGGDEGAASDAFYNASPGRSGGVRSTRDPASGGRLQGRISSLEDAMTVAATLDDENDVRALVSRVGELPDVQARTIGGMIRGDATRAARRAVLESWLSGVGQRAHDRAPSDLERAKIAGIMATVRERLSRAARDDAMMDYRQQESSARAENLRARTAQTAYRLGATGGGGRRGMGRGELADLEKIRADAVRTQDGLARELESDANRGDAEAQRMDVAAERLGPSIDSALVRGEPITDQMLAEAGIFGPDAIKLKTYARATGDWASGSKQLTQELRQRAAQARAKAQEARIGAERQRAMGRQIRASTTPEALGSSLGGTQYARSYKASGHPVLSPLIVTPEDRMPPWMQGGLVPPPVGGPARSTREALEWLSDDEAPTQAERPSGKDPLDWLDGD